MPTGDLYIKIRLEGAQGILNKVMEDIKPLIDKINETKEEIPEIAIKIINVIEAHKKRVDTRLEKLLSDKIDDIIG